MCVCVYVAVCVRTCSRNVFVPCWVKCGSSAHRAAPEFRNLSELSLIRCRQKPGAFWSLSSAQKSVKLLPWIDNHHNYRQIAASYHGQLTKYGTSKTPPGCLLFLKYSPSQLLRHMWPHVGMSRSENPLKEAILPNAKAIELLHILSDKQPQRALFFFFLPSS